MFRTGSEFRNTALIMKILLSVMLHMLETYKNCKLTRQRVVRVDFDDFTLTNIFRLRSSAFQLWWICVSRDAGGISRSTSRRAGLAKSWTNSRGITDRVNVLLPPTTPIPPPAPAPLSRLMLFTLPGKGKWDQFRFGFYNARFFPNVQPCAVTLDFLVTYAI